MKFVVTPRAPASLGRAGQIVEMTKSQAAYRLLRGDVVAAAAVRKRRRKR